MSCHQLGSHGPATPNPAQPTACLCALGLTVSARADPLGSYGSGIDAGALDWSDFTPADFQNWEGHGAPG